MWGESWEVVESGYGFVFLFIFYLVDEDFCCVEYVLGFMLVLGL